MRRIQKKDLPNLITCVRIVASIVILFLPSFQFWFYLNYLLCGITDVVDGILARKLQAVSETGARLDSFADALFVCCIVTVLWQSIRLPLMVSCQHWSYLRFETGSDDGGIHTFS